jgi:hypothetical protein
MYPDVFEPPKTLEQLSAAAGQALTSFRDRVLAPIGIGLDVPVHVCENGWPTGSRRSTERQVACVETLVRSIDAVAGELNVTHWELFTLRDADAFERLTELYSELG